jgi:hypothetical protein
MLTLIVISVLLLSVYGQQNKDICPSIRTVICVKDVLLDIVNAAKEIKNIVDKIEQHIVNIIFDIQINPFLDYSFNVNRLAIV